MTAAIVDPGVEPPTAAAGRTRKSELVAMCVLILVIILATYSILFRGSDGAPSAPPAPQRVIQVVRASRRAVTSLEFCTFG